MRERMMAELELLRRYYPNVEYREDGYWWRIPDFPIPGDHWNITSCTVAFQAPTGYPGQPPYSFYIQPGIRLKGTDQKPNNYEEPASGVPFEGIWGKFSWAHEDLWRPTADVASGSNLHNFVRTFPDRFRQGA